MTRQLYLNVTLRDEATFANFFPGRNTALLESLVQPRENLLFLQGCSGSGLTHLLQALCQQQTPCLYLPLKNASELSPRMLEDAEQLALLAIDDIEAIAGNMMWEEALFHAFNRFQAQQKKLVIASHRELYQLDLKLADLKSRLQSMLVLTVYALDDHEKIQALQRRARQRGLILSVEVASFIMNHASREMQDLLALLNKLDKASLQTKRRLTIPFVKEVLAE